MPRGVKKCDLPVKICANCEKPFTWRKKWEACWSEVQTCSKRCKAERRATRKRSQPARAKKEQATNLRGGSTKGGFELEAEGPQQTQTLSGPLPVPLLFLMSLGMRIELFFKNTVELTHQASFLRRNQITRVNLPNKRKDDPVLSWCSALKKACPDVDVCPHYSLKYQYRGSPDKTFLAFEKFCAAARKEGIEECLLISGGGKKRKSDLSTLDCLRRIQRRRASEARKMRIGVAFNPYFPDDREREQERRNLRNKLATGMVASVWLQIGADTRKLEEGLGFLKEEIKTLQQSGQNDRKAGNPPAIDIYASLFVPSPRLLNNMKFRPWNGVFLSGEYLESVESAEEISARILEIYAQHGVKVLCETAMRTEKDLERLGRLMKTTASSEEPLLTQQDVDLKRADLLSTPENRDAKSSVSNLLDGFSNSKRRDITLDDRAASKLRRSARQGRRVQNSVTSSGADALRQSRAAKQKWT